MTSFGVSGSVIFVYIFVIRYWSCSRFDIPDVNSHFHLVVLVMWSRSSHECEFVCIKHCYVIIILFQSAWYVQQLGHAKNIYSWQKLFATQQRLQSSERKNGNLNYALSTSKTIILSAAPHAHCCCKIQLQLQHRLQNTNFTAVFYT